MKNIYYLIVVTMLLFLGGCAQPHIADYARVSPGADRSALHPDDMDGDIISFSIVIPLEYIVEVNHGVKGVWSIVAGHMTEDAPIEDGFCYAVEERSFSNNIWCDILAKCVMTGNKKDYTGYKVAIASQDGITWIASPIKGGMLDEKRKQWNNKKFENDFAHRTEVLSKVGQTLDDINVFWHRRAGQFGLTMDDDVVEIAVTDYSVRWQNFRKEFIAEMGYELTLPNGDNVVSQISRDEMVRELSRNPRISRWQKFSSKLFLPLGTPEVMLFGFGSSVLNGGVAAMINSDWEARVARGVGQYRDMASQIVYVAEQVRQCKQQSDIERYITSLQGEN